MTNNQWVTRNKLNLIIEEKDGKEKIELAVKITLQIYLFIKQTTKEEKKKGTV